MEFKLYIVKSSLIDISNISGDFQRADNSDGLGEEFSFTIAINRKDRYSKNKEEIKMALDIENNNQAYLCGRLFAVLEKVQSDALPGLNRTIKDSYFASACANPSTVFPKLIKLSQYHIEKLEYKVKYKIVTGEIMDKLNGKFPKTLPLSEQGKFIIGYYQQTQDFYKKKEDKEI